MEVPMNPKLKSLIRKVRHDRKKTRVLQAILLDGKKADQIMIVKNIHDETI